MLLVHKQGGELHRYTGGAGVGKWKGLSLSTYTVMGKWLRVRARDEEEQIGLSGTGFRKWEREEN
jgi:hypothetical protein